MRAKEEQRVAKSKKLAEDTRAANAALQAFRLQEAQRAKEQELAIEGRCQQVGMG